MKFLIDAQLPSKLCEILNTVSLESVHVDSLPEGDESKDSFITNYADRNGLIVITKDTDFYHSHMLNGKPSKIMLVTTGNIKNRALFELIRANATTIESLFQSCDYIELTNNGIIGHAF